MSNLTTVFGAQVTNAMNITPAPGACGTVLEHTTEKGKIESERAKERKTVCVSIKTRPANNHEKASASAQDCISIEEGTGGVKVSINDGAKVFSKDFDNGFVHETQEQVFDVIGKPMLKAAFEGYNVTLFAYGQTGAGKTYSVMGKESKQEMPGRPAIITGYNWGKPEFEGLVPRFIRHALQYGSYLMTQKKEVKLVISAMQVYMDNVNDLLSPDHEKILEVRADPTGGFCIPDLRYHAVDTEARAQKLIELALKNRKLGSHSMNDSSSRSHCLLGMQLIQLPGLTRSQIYIVDLAGSEKIEKVGVVPGSQMAKEAAFINQSLTSLRMALAKIATGAKPTNLRDSKLTMILANSFGGNSKTWMLCCCSPALLNSGESMTTLVFADVVKKIVNVPKKSKAKDKKELEGDMGRIASLEESNRVLEEAVKRLEEEKEELRKAFEQLSTNSPRQLDNSPPGSPVASFDSDLFIGTAEISLANCVLGTMQKHVLPLKTNKGGAATLYVTTYSPEELEDESPWPTFSNVEDAVAKFKTTRFDFIVAVVQACNIPKEYSAKVHCKYYFKNKEDKPLKTVELAGPDPVFNYRKRYAFRSMDEKLLAFLQSKDCITFVVTGMKAAGADFDE